MLQINFNPFPNLHSEHLFLRELTVADADEIFEIRSNAETMKYIPRPLAKTRQDALDLIKMVRKGILDNEFIHWAITQKESSKLLGMICLLRMKPEHFRTEIGYILHPDFHRQGIMSEAIKMVIDYAFRELHFHSIEAVIDPDNSASEKVLVKNHFVKEAHLKENEFYNGKFLDTVIYSLLNTENGK